MKCLNWGIIGCSRLVAEDLVRSMDRCQENHQVICAADSNSPNAVNFLEEFKIRNVKVYCDYAALLENPDVGKIPQLFWATEKFTKTNGPLKGGKVQEIRFPLEDPTKYNFMNGGGLRYQLDHIFERIRNGHTSSNITGLESSVLLAETLDAVRRQLGVYFPQD